jgi:hypothetical protein
LRSLEKVWMTCFVPDASSNNNNNNSREGSRGSHIHHRRKNFSIDEEEDSKNINDKNNAKVEINKITSPTNNKIMQEKPGKEFYQKKYYVNLKTSHTQWTKPFQAKTFRSHDVDINSFVTTLIRRDVFAKRFFFFF